MLNFSRLISYFFLDVPSFNVYKLFSSKYYTFLVLLIFNPFIFLNFKEMKEKI